MGFQAAGRMGLGWRAGASCRVVRRSGGCGWLELVCLLSGDPPANPAHLPNRLLQAGDQSEYVGAFRRVLLDAAARLGPAM